MKKYKLKKDHLDKKAGDSLELTPEQENYFVRVGLIEGDTKEDKKPKAAKKK